MLRAVLAGGVLSGGLMAASAGHAQSAYDTSLRSIAPATINQASFDARARSPIQSIGPATLENRSTMVPAVFDASLGRFVSAIGTSRGAISVSSASAIWVIVSSQNSAFVVGNAANSSPQRSEPIASASAILATPAISATVSGAAR